MNFNELLTKSVQKDKATELAGEFFANMENLSLAMKKADELIAVKRDSVTLNMRFNEGVSSFSKKLGDAVERNGGVKSVMCTAVTGAAMSVGAIGFINECINASNGYVNKSVLALTCASLVTAAVSEYIKDGVTTVGRGSRNRQANKMVVDMMDTVGGLERAKSVIDAAISDVSGVLQRYAGDDWGQFHKDSVFDALETIVSDPHISETLKQADKLASAILLVASDGVKPEEPNVKTSRASKFGLS